MPDLLPDVEQDRAALEVRLLQVRHEAAAVVGPQRGEEPVRDGGLLGLGHAPPSWRERASLSRPRPVEGGQYPRHRDGRAASNERSAKEAVRS